MTDFNIETTRDTALNWQETYDYLAKHLPTFKSLHLDTPRKKMVIRTYHKPKNLMHTITWDGFLVIYPEWLDAVIKAIVLQELEADRTPPPDHKHTNPGADLHTEYSKPHIPRRR